MEGCVITSKDVLEKTGLKSAKTLTRWHQRGLIPEPLVRTHPSGRGKLAYWPDWVLDDCLRIVEFQRRGYSLQSIARMLEIDCWKGNCANAKSEKVSISDLLAIQHVELDPGREGTRFEALVLAISSSVKHLLSDDADRRVLLAKLREKNALDLGLNLACAGYNPFLLYDGQDVDIVPDFLVSTRICERGPSQGAFAAAALLPALRKVFPVLEKLVGSTPKVWPAPKVWVPEGDAVVEYMYYPAGALGFELIRETAKVVNTSPKNAGIDAHGDAGA